MKHPLKLRHYMTAAVWPLDRVPTAVLATWRAAPHGLEEPLRVVPSRAPLHGYAEGYTVFLDLDPLTPHFPDWFKDYATAALTQGCGWVEFSTGYYTL